MLAWATSLPGRRGWPSIAFIRSCDEDRAWVSGLASTGENCTKTVPKPVSSTGLYQNTGLVRRAIQLLAALFVTAWEMFGTAFRSALAEPGSAAARSMAGFVRC